VAKILITGGFGFLGSHLTELLLEDSENEIHVVDNLSTSPIDLDDYLGQLPAGANLTYDIQSIQEYFATSRVRDFDRVYHLASPVGPAGVLQHAGEMVREIVTDSYILIDYCVARDASLLDVSTSEVYGGGQEGFCPESTPKIVPPRTTVRLEYAIAKLAAETAIINTCVAKQLRAMIVRPFNIAGARQSPRGGFVLPRFIQQASASADITVFGDGSALRAFTHVRDMVQGIKLVMERGKPGEAYNIGNPHNKTSILRLAEDVIRILQSQSRIVFVDGKKIYGPLYEEANNKFPDATKAMTELGWMPEFDVERTIRDAYAEYRRQSEAGVLRDAVVA
jgi:UDP-glucose 4-epimerase